MDSKNANLEYRLKIIVNTYFQYNGKSLIIEIIPQKSKLLLWGGVMVKGHLIDTYDTTQ